MTLCSATDNIKYVMVCNRNSSLTECDTLYRYLLKIELYSIIFR